MNKLKKIAKALKVALLSLFHMDLQIDVEEEEEEEEKKKLKVFKSASILLTITTILSIIVFYIFRGYFLIIGLALSAGWLGFIVVAIEKF
jgi:hypothetical protein